LRRARGTRQPLGQRPGVLSMSPMHWPYRDGRGRSGTGLPRPAAGGPFSERQRVEAAEVHVTTDRAQHQWPGAAETGWIRPTTCLQPRASPVSACRSEAPRRRQPRPPRSARCTPCWHQSV